MGRAGRAKKRRGVVSPPAALDERTAPSGPLTGTRLAGIARHASGAPEGPVLQRVVVTGEAGELVRSEKLEPFELETEGGATVRVEPSPRIVLAPTTTAPHRWRDLASELVALAPSKKNKGPDLEVDVARTTVANGERVELLCSDVEYAFEEAGDHRNAPARRPSRVTAIALTTGSDARALLDQLAADPSPKQKPWKRRIPPWKPSPIGMGAVAAGVGLTALALVLRLSPFSVDLGCLGVEVLALTVASWGVTRTSQFVRGASGRGEAAGSPDVTIGIVAALFPTTVPMLTLSMGDANGTSNVSLLSVIGLVALSLFLLGYVFVRTQRNAGLLHALLDSPPLPTKGPLADRWGSFEGVVRDPTPVVELGEAMAMVHVVDTTVVSGSDPNIVVERVLSKGTFFVDRDGASFELNPANAFWTSSVRLTQTVTRGGDRHIEETQAVPIDGVLLVAGRAERSAEDTLGTLHATQPESLVFVAVREGESPRTWARSLLRARRIALVTLLASTMVGSAIAVFVMPKLPPWHVAVSGD